MNRRRKRQIYYVCSALSESNELLSESIPAASVEDATKIFVEKCGTKPQTIFGPFFKKKTQVLENTTNIRLSNLKKKAEYNGWIVLATILKYPENYAFLLFNKRIDGKNLPKPQGTIVVPIHDLRFINVE